MTHLIVGGGLAAPLQSGQVVDKDTSMEPHLGNEASAVLFVELLGGV